MEEAEQKGEILSSNVAIFEDRINVRQRKVQFYASKLFSDKTSGI